MVLTIRKSYYANYFVPMFELDSQVATKVFKWIFRPDGWLGRGYYDGEMFVAGEYFLPPWSTDIAVAWQLVTHFSMKGASWQIETVKKNKHGSFVRLTVPVVPHTDKVVDVEAEANVGEMPRAIALAAVKAADAIEHHEINAKHIKTNQ